MQANTAYTFEINLNAQNYTPKTPVTFKTLHLNSWRTEAQKPSSDSKFKLTRSEQFGCCMATD
jgi:hypothetical protein